MNATATTALKLKPSDIEVVKDFNPRTEMDKAKLNELAASIKQVGLIQPLVVGEKTDKGKYPLIAGHRRFAALKQNRAKEVEVRIQVEGNAKTIAVTENLQREAVNPIDEANGFAQVMEADGLNQKQLAEKLGISTSQVSDRLKLLKLPPAAQDGIASGKLPASAGPFLEKLAQISDEVGEIAAKILTGLSDADRVLVPVDAHAMGMFFTEVVKAAGDQGIFLVRVDGGIHSILRQLKPTDPERKAILAKVRKSRDDYSSGAWQHRPDWDRPDTDAARKFKVLYEQKVSQNTTIRLVFDEPFLYDRLAQSLDKYEAALEKAKAEEKKSAAGGGEDAKKKAAAAKREEDRIGRIVAQNHNDELGVRLREQFATAEVTLPRMKMLALLILNQDSYNTNPAFGTVLTTPDFHDKDVRHMKDGREVLKVEPIPADSADENVKREVLAATSVEEVLGIVFRVLLAAMHVDKAALAVAEQPRYHWSIPGTGYSDDEDFSPRAQLLRESLDLFDGEKRADIEKQLEEFGAIDDVDVTDDSVAAHVDAQTEVGMDPSAGTMPEGLDEIADDALTAAGVEA